MLWLIALIPAVAGAALLAAGVRSRLWLGAAACGALSVNAALASVGVFADWTGRLAWSGALELTAKLTTASAAMAILVPVIAMPVLAYAAAHEHPPGLNRLVALLLVFVGGMELLVIADDLLTLLIGWELVGACSWALISHEWRDAENPSAGRYAFLITRFGDLGMFAAAMAAFAGTGSFAFDGLDGLPEPYLSVVAFGLLLSAAAKSGQVPFSPWLFRAMAGPTSVSALLHAATMVAAGAYLLIRLDPSLSHAEGFATTAIAFGLMTALAGGLVAVLQIHAKKLLAASTSAHFGLMFAAVGAGYPAVALLHLIAHAAFKAPLFLAAGIAGERAGTYALNQMGFGRALPVTAALTVVAALALAGIPPLGGGWTKEAIIGAVEHQSGWLTVGVILAGALSAAYAARFHWLAYGAVEGAPGISTPSRTEIMALAMLAAMTLLLSFLWLPSVHESLARLLEAEIPKSTTAVMIVSFLLLVVGLLTGVMLARRYPAMGAEGAPAAAADWLGVPSLIGIWVTRPFSSLARSAARFDDAVIDAGPRAVGRAAGVISQALSRGDRKLVDRGVENVAAFVTWLARMGERIGESIIDGMPEGSARLVGLSARDARNLQTGLSHHYYAILAGGSASLVIALILAA